MTRLRRPSVPSLERGQESVGPFPFRALAPDAYFAALTCSTHVQHHAIGAARSCFTALTTLCRDSPRHSTLAALSPSVGAILIALPFGGEEDGCLMLMACEDCTAVIASALPACSYGGKCRKLRVSRLPGAIGGHHLRQGMRAIPSA